MKKNHLVFWGSAWECIRSWTLQINWIAHRNFIYKRKILRSALLPFVSLFRVVVESVLWFFIEMMSFSYTAQHAPTASKITPKSNWNKIAAAMKSNAKQRRVVKWRHNWNFLELDRSYGNCVQIHSRYAWYIRFSCNTHSLAPHLKLTTRSHIPRDLRK